MNWKLTRELGTGLRSLAGFLLVVLAIRWQPENGFWADVVWTACLLFGLELFVGSVLRDREERGR